MDEEERKRKLEAGKAKLASFRKKKKHKHKHTKHDKSEDKSHGVDDSTAVQTGDDSMSRDLSSDIDDLSTTADEMSTEEETSMAGGLSPRERMQELELTISDQQVALQKLTIENKTLREHEVEMESVITERDTVIETLKQNVQSTAMHVKQLQQNISQATKVVQVTGHGRGEVVDELLKARTELEKFQQSVSQQEAAMHDIADKLAVKSLEAAEAQESVKSLMVELERTRSVTQPDSKESLSSLKSDHEREINSLRVEMDTHHEKQLDVLRKQHEDEKRKFLQHREQELSRARSDRSMDGTDVRTLQEQIAHLNAQLESNYRDAEKARKKHDNEVVKLNQQLINIIDEYETKVAKERDNVAELESKLDMCDTVNSEIQTSLSQQMQQLEEERDLLQSRLRDEGSKSKENASLSSIIQELRDEVDTYKEDATVTEKQLEETNSQKRKLLEDVNRMQEKFNNEAKALTQLQKKFDDASDEISSLMERLDQKEIEMEEIVQKSAESEKVLQAEYEEKLRLALEEQKTAMEEEHCDITNKLKLKLDEEISKALHDHSEELKQLHLQHVKQMDEVKKEMEDQLIGLRETLEHERKQQIGSVKDVNEKTRLREITDLKNIHEDEVDHLHNEHLNMINELKEEFHKEKLHCENEIRTQMQNDFDGQMLVLKQNSESNLQETVENLKKDLKSQHDNESKIITDKVAMDIKEKYESLLTEEKELFREQLEAKVREIENFQNQYETEKAALILEHQNSVELLQVEHHSEMTQHEQETKRFLEEAKSEHEAAIQLIKNEADDRDKTEQHVEEQVENLKKQMSDGTSKLDAEYKQSLATKEEEFRKLQDAVEQEVEQLKENLSSVEKERDDILAQAEESRKRLESLHEEEMTSLQVQLNTAIESHTARIKQMQMDIEASRASRAELKDLKSELEARSAAVEEIEELRSYYMQEQTNLQEKFEEQMRELRDEHSTVMEQSRMEVPDEIREEMVQLRHQVEEYREKLSFAETTLATIRTSSPGRPLSSASDYDSSKIEAMNKDYRDAMTLTHINDLSGLDELEEGTLNISAEEEEIADKQTEDGDMEEGEIHSMEEGELAEVKSTETSHEDTKDDENENHLAEEVESLLKKIKALEEEIQNLNDSHKQQTESLSEKQEEIKLQMCTNLEQEVETLKEQHKQELDEVNNAHTKALKQLEEEKLQEITQLRLQCVSETAAQIEEELTKLTEQLNHDNARKIDESRQELETEHQNRIIEIHENHGREMEELTERHSSSMEERLAAVMQELYNQKQEAAKEAFDLHKKQLDDLQEDKNNSDEEWKIKYENLNNDCMSLKDQIQTLTNEHQSLQESIESGEVDHIKLMKSEHAANIEQIKLSLSQQHETQLDQALDQQSQQFEQAQEEYLSQHQKQIDAFIADHKEEVEVLQKEKEDLVAKLKNDHRIQIDDLERRLKNSFQATEVEKFDLLQEEKSKLLEEHNEELKAVAIKLVEVSTERDELLNAKIKLSTDIENLSSDHQTALSHLKTSLISQHMEKFQGTIAELDQHHLQELEKLREQHETETTEYKKIAEDTINKLKEMENSTSTFAKESQQKHKDEVDRIKMEHDEIVDEMKKKHLQEVEEMNNQQADEIAAIQREILSNEDKYKNDLADVLETQTSQLDDIKNQFEVVLATAKSSAEEKINELQATNTRLEEQISSIATDTKVSNEALAEQQLKFTACERQLEEVTKSYEAKLEKVSESLERSVEELADLNRRVEFERAEYESEIEQLQTEINAKEDIEKQLRNELDERVSNMKTTNEEFENVISKRERETQEEDNLIKMLREDQENYKKEMSKLQSINKRLLSSLSDLVNANNKCEDVITQRINAVARDNQHSSSSSSSDGSHKDGLDEQPLPKLVTSGGSFVDEGLEVSQRLSESLFAGPDLDTSTIDVVVDSGHRLTQAVGRLLDTMESNAQQLIVAPQSQVYLGRGKPTSPTSSIKYDDDVTKEQLVDQIEKMEKVMDTNAQHQQELETLLQEYAQKASDAEEKLQQLQEEVVSQLRAEDKLKEDQELLQKEKDALSSNVDEKDKNLFQLMEDLSSEKRSLIEQFEDSRQKYDGDIQQLETTLESAIQQLEQREKEHSNEREDFLQQIDALQKQTSSQSKFSTEQLNERELERDQYESELSQLRKQLEKKPAISKTEMQEISRLEEELANKDQLHQEQLENFKNEEAALRRQLKEQEDALQMEQQDSDQLRGEMDSVSQEREVLKEELDDALMKVASLEAKLDNYKLGPNATMEGLLGGAGDHSRELERFQMALQKERDLLESKENEIEHLVEIHSQLRSEIREKEEQIERLINESDQHNELEAENYQLKAELEENVNKTESVQVTTYDQLSALSQHLLEEKNMQIDELSEKNCQLQDQLDELENEKEQIENLQQELKQANEKINARDSLQQMESEVLNWPEQNQTKMLEIMKENEQLQEQINNLMLKVEEGSIILPHGTKEKIRDLEEQWLKEVDTAHTEEEEACVVDDKLVLTHRNNKDVESPKESNVMKEKLLEIANELKVIPNSVIGRILRDHNQIVNDKDETISSLEDKLSQQKDNIIEFQAEICDLKKELDAPDVTIQMNDRVDNNNDLPVFNKVETTSSGSSSGGNDHLELESPPSSPDHQSVDVLKNFIKEKEKENFQQAEVIKKQSDAIADQESEKESIANELKNSVLKCEKMQIELEKRLNEISPDETPASEMTPQELIQLDNVKAVIQQATDHLEDNITAKEEEIKMVEQEKERLSSDLRDVQREYMALLKDSDAFQEAEEVKQHLEDKICELEQLLRERENELLQTQQECDNLVQEKAILGQQIKEIEHDREPSKENSLIEELAEKDDLITSLCADVSEKEETIEELNIKIQTLNQNLAEKITSSQEDIDLLQNEQQILSSENASLQSVVDELKTTNEKLNEMNQQKEVELDNIKQDLDGLMKQQVMEIEQLQNEMNEEVVKPLQAQESLQSSSLASSGSRLEYDDLLRQHQEDMDKLKEEVEASKEEVQREHQREILQIIAKHRSEVAGLLSESNNGGVSESELAQKLREELDLADRLDSKLVGHFHYDDDGQASGDKPDVSARLQDLLTRVHEEGIEVLSLSELQFIRQQQLKNASTTTPTKKRKSTEAMVAKQQAWEGEKAALINAMQALKELLMHTADETQEGCEEAVDHDPHSWRDDMLKLMGEFFERDRDCLLSELRTSVVEAQNAIQEQVDEDILPEEATATALKKLEEVQEKIVQQSLSHQETLAKMKSLDRDELLDELKELQNGRQKRIEKAEDQIKDLRVAVNNKNNELSSTIHDAQSQISQLQSKLQQEHAMLEDALNALQFEKTRSNDQLMPAIDRERQRVAKLEAEISELQSKLTDEAATSLARTNKLLTELDDNRSHMDSLQEEVTNLRKKLDIADQEIEALHKDNDQLQEQAQGDINELRGRLDSANDLQGRTVDAFEQEKKNAYALREELAQERSQNLEETSKEKEKVQNLSAEVESNQMKHDHVVALLNREKEQSEKLHGLVENQQREAEKIHARDKDAIHQLNGMLEKSKRDVNVLKNKLNALEREAKASEQIIEAERKSHDNEIGILQKQRATLETAVTELQLQKHETEKNLDELERDVVQLQEKSNSIPRISDEDAEELLAHRRHLEAIRQRLQLEGTKLQDLVAKTAVHIPYSDQLDGSITPHDQLESDSEQVDSIKRTLGGMQAELREMYNEMSNPEMMRNSNASIGTTDAGLNQRLLQQNAELTQAVTSASDEKTALRDAIRKLQNELWEAKHDGPAPSNQEREIMGKQQQIQEMANRMHRLYTRYMRAESFRKALVYQKKYMLLLIGGFQDCEDTTLALIARMGAFPAKGATNYRTQRSRAFTRFRSAVRAVIAVSRLKFLVRKWERHSNSVSDAILGKHGTAPVVNRRKISRQVSPSNNQLRPTSAGFMHDRSPSPSPLPQRSYSGYRSADNNNPIKFTPPVKLSTEPSSSYRRSGVIPDTTIATGYRPQPAYNDYRMQPERLPTNHTSQYQPNYSRSTAYGRLMDRPAESDPSLNAYIQRLENLQHRLNQDPHLYPR